MKKHFFLFAALLAVGLFTAEARAELRAGAAKVDVTPLVLPVIRNGGFIEATDNKVVDPLHGRCLVLDDRVTRLAIVVVDSCMLPRDLCTRASTCSASRMAVSPAASGLAWPSRPSSCSSSSAS